MPSGSGFDGRVFLTDDEYEAFLRRHPVRYVKAASGVMCAVCGEPGEEQNPLQSAHVIGFMRGVIEFGLTPEWLDQEINLVRAHRKTCNRAAELPIDRVEAVIVERGGELRSAPAVVRQRWNW